MKLKILTDNDILQISNGEVTSPRLVDTKGMPIDDGLLCQIIFGPVEDFVCKCGKTKGIENTGRICSMCGVTVNHSSVRLKTYGHIDLVFKTLNPLFGDTICKVFSITKSFFKKLVNGSVGFKLEPGSKFVVNGEIYDLVPCSKKTTFNDLYEVVKMLDVNKTISVSKNKTQIKCLSMFKHNKPKDLFFSKILVPPPDVREGFNDATNVVIGDKNKAYSEIIKISNYLKDLKILYDDVPEVIKTQVLIRLQVLLNGLFVEGLPESQSIVDDLKSKNGFIRNNVFAKRVNFSGRSVITPDPTLPIDKISIPKQMAIEILYPFILRNVIKSNGLKSIKEAKRLIHKDKSKLDEALNDVLSENKNLLINRQPTLHKYGLMSFGFDVHDGKTIKIPPMVTKPFNADFDGDSIDGFINVFSTRNNKWYNHIHISTIPKLFVDDVKLTETTIKNGKKVIKYSVSNLLVNSINIETKAIELKPITRFSEHQNIDMYKVSSKHFNTFWASDDHSLLIESDNTITKESPKTLINCKDDKFFIQDVDQSNV